MEEEDLSMIAVVVLGVNGRTRNYSKGGQTLSEKGGGGKGWCKGVVAG